MKAPNIPSLTNLIGVLLVVVALVSAGGLFYVASEYSKISDTYVSAEASISGLRFVRNNISGEVTISILVSLDNPSDLDIEIYRIECNTNVDQSTTLITASDRFVGAASVGDTNGTVRAGTIREVQISQSIHPDTIYMERLEHALDGGEQLSAYVFGLLWFRIADYPDVKRDRIPMVYFGPVVIQDV